MLRISSELRLWKRPAVVEVLREALAVADEVDPPEGLREAVFTQAVGLLAQRQVEIEQVGLGVPNMAIPRSR